VVGAPGSAPRSISEKPSPAMVARPGSGWCLKRMVEQPSHCRNAALLLLPRVVMTTTLTR
jgi:hypothetical protein